MRFFRQNKILAALGAGIAITVVAATAILVAAVGATITTIPDSLAVAKIEQRLRNRLDPWAVDGVLHVVVHRSTTPDGEPFETLEV